MLLSFWLYEKKKNILIFALITRLTTSNENEIRNRFDTRSIKSDD